MSSGDSRLATTERDSALSLVRASKAVKKSRAIEQVVADLQASSGEKIPKAAA
jgi:hypothetical protein